jgi:peptidoglycan/LPS O-acetylase OafA/YrhL
MKIPAVDVLRGVAALGVAWYHSRVDLWVGFKAIQADPAAYSAIDRALSWLSLPASQMGSMVMLFFVLSGFCIHLPSAGKCDMPDWRAYTVRRFFRIYPAYFATLLVCFLGAWILFSRGVGNPPPPSEYAASAAMLQNWIFHGQVGMNPSLWSIPVEVELYIVYPLLLWIHLRFGMRAALFFTVACTAFGWAFFLFGWANPWGSFFRYAVMWNAGAWLAERYVGGNLPRWTVWHGVAMCGVFVLSMLAGLAGLKDYLLSYGWAFSSFLLLWWALGPGQGFFHRRSVWLRCLGFCGVVSYSIYLLHFPLFRMAGAVWQECFGAKPQSFLVPTVAVAMVVPAAWIFYRWIEEPAQKIGRRLAVRMERRA